jgi:hypothetical protein
MERSEILACTATIRVVFVLPHPRMIPARLTLPHDNAPGAS